ncbi:hypothetical protein [Helicobacter cetorum]|uniref:Uncharacterized protein n=1 Tax=Helicobacter cetorum (strain ATCC BAA-540 / CCUG 52418 / MIT 99-5656) TaxID=1163745 RepID=I0ESZ7_HELCM|nr:hypothetical protein [Helicobacter cetorum]AFI06066.1 hypothetical protein HCD_05320 [Helicobacter cetorum MIT 99-5656]
MLDNGLRAFVKQKDKIKVAYKIGINNSESLKNNPFFTEFDLNTITAIEFKGNEDFYPKESHEWLVIKDSDLSFFKRIKECLKQCDNAKPNFKDLSFLAFVYNKSILNIQKITPKYKIEKRWFAWLDFNGDEVQYQCNLYENGIELGNSVDAIIDLRENAIYFKKFEILTALDKDFIEYYKEATENELNTFTKEIKTLGLEITMDYKDIKPLNLKKINLLLKKDEKNNNKSKLDIFCEFYDDFKNYARNFKSPLYTNEKFKPLKENKDITELLKILNEDYYMTYITKKKRATNSSVAI